MTNMYGDWFETGFPEPEPASEAQRHLLNRNLSIVLDMLPEEERFAVELEGVEEWLNRQTKQSASIHINRIKNIKKQARDRAIASKVIERDGKLCICGQVMERIDDGYRCKHCGKVEFHVKMR